MNNTYYRELISVNTDENLDELSYFTKDYIEDVFEKSRGQIDIYNLERLEVVLKDIVSTIPEAGKAIVADLEGHILYQADSTASYHFQRGDRMKVGIERRPGVKVRKLISQDSLRGYLLLYKNKEYIESRTFDLFLDSLTIIAVSLLFSFQLLVFGNLFVDRAHRDNPIQMKAREYEVQDPIKRKNKYRILRIIAFLFFMAEFIPLSFLPLLIRSVYEANPLSIFGLSKEVILGLPISIYLIGISLTVLITGFLSQRISVKKTFYIFVSLHLIGSVFTAFASNILLLILARFIVGLGYGGVLISGINLVIQATTIRDRSTGFGFWFAGYSTANICAISIGGVLANRLGYSAGLVIGAFFAGLLLLFITFYIKEVKPDMTHPYGKAKFKLSDLVVLFKNRTLFSLLMFSAVPTQITFIGLFTYAFPLYMSDIGISQSNIGRLLTIYGLMLLLSPVIGGLADRFKKERAFIILGGLVLGMTLLLFSIAEGLLIAVFAIIAIGIADVFSTSTRGSYLTLAREAKDIGESKISSIFMTFEKIFTITAPLIAGSLIAIQGYSGTIVTMGIIMLVSVVLFTIFSQNLRKLHEEE
jgi:predicted MFS family arabinose efflux permease